MPKNNAQPLTIFIPCHEPWDRTADFLRQTALRLSKQHTVVLILIYQGKFWLKGLAEITPKHPSTASLFFSQPLWFIPGKRWPFIHKLNQQIWAWWLMVQFKLKKPGQAQWLWLFSPEDWFLPRTIPGIKSLYDCVDDHAQLETTETKRLKHQEKILIQTADLFFTNSHVLADLHAKLRQPDEIVVQGFDTALWPKKIESTKTKPKTLLLMGGLDERVDWSLLQWLMTKLPDYTLNLAGPIAATVTAQSQKLLRLKNVHYHGALPRKALHTLLIQAQLCLIPYNTKLPAAKHSFPMKVLEFFAYGKPVVSSNITELNRYAPYVTIANTQAEWLTAIKTLTQKPWPTKLQKTECEIAWSHRYEAKLAQILDHVYSKV